MLVRIAGDRHDARSERGYIEEGSEIVVIGGDDLGLLVRRVEPGETVTLPEHGKEVHGSFGQRVAAEEAREEAKQARWESGRRRYGLATGGLLGAVAAGGGVWLVWDLIAEQAAASPWAVAAAIVAGGAVCGALLFRGVDAALREVGGDYWRFTTASVTLGLAGGTAGAVGVIPSAGLVWGAVVALGATLALAAVAPVIGMLIEWLTGGGDS